MAKEKQLSQKELEKYSTVLAGSKTSGTFQKALGQKTTQPGKSKFRQIDVSLGYPQKDTYKAKVMAKYGSDVYTQAEKLEKERAQQLGMEVAGSPDTQAKIIENRIMMAKEQQAKLRTQEYKQQFKDQFKLSTDNNIYSRAGSGLKQSFQDFTGQTAKAQREQEVAAAKELALEVALSKGQIPKFLEEATMTPSPSQLKLQQSASKIGVVPLSSLQQYGGTVAQNIGFQGRPSYDIAVMPQRAEAYLGTDVFQVANPSLPSYAQQAEKARVLTGQTTGAGSRSPLDTIRDATGIVRQQQVFQSNTDKIRDLTSQSAMGMSPEEKIRRFTGAQPQYYQQPFEVGQPINPMGVQFQQQPFMQRTIDPYQQQMMQEMRAQRAAERQQQRAIEDQIVAQKVRSMNSIGQGVNMNMAGGVNVSKQRLAATEFSGSGYMADNDGSVPSPREAGVSTPASRPVTYRRGPYKRY